MKILLLSEVSDCYDFTVTCCVPKLKLLLLRRHSNCWKLMTRCCVPKLKLSLFSRNSDYDYLLHAQSEVGTVEQDL